MALQTIRKSESIEATDVINGYTYHVSYSVVDGAWVSTSIRIISSDGMERGTFNKDMNTTNAYMQAGEDIFTHSQALSALCDEVENSFKKKEPEN